MPVYDIFTFNNEIEMLLVRLVEHSPFVDQFILLQGDKTFTGKPKPLINVLGDPRIKSFQDRIILKTIRLDEKPNSPWDNELKQRNASFSAVSIRENDVVFLSDVDEIISRNSWKNLLERMKSEKVLSVWLEMFNFFINYRLVDSMWLQPKLIRGDLILQSERTANDFRVDYSLPRTDGWCGWHFSFVMSENQIADKISSYSHQEFNRPIFTSQKRIKDQLRKRRDLLKRRLKFEPVEVTDGWPLQMLKDSYWKQFICSTDPIESSFFDFFSDFLFRSGECLKLQRLKIRQFLKFVWKSVSH